MDMFLKDISFSECSCDSSYFDNLELFFGKAICLDFSEIHHNDIIDLIKLKRAISTNKHAISCGDIVLLYTGHSDRFYNTSLWEKPRSFMTISALDYLAEIGIKNLGIDAPFILKGVDPRYTSMAITYSLCNIGHLVNSRFLYIGFPLSVPGASKLPIRAFALL